MENTSSVSDRVQKEKKYAICKFFVRKRVRLTVRDHSHVELESCTHEALLADANDNRDGRSIITREPWKLLLAPVYLPLLPLLLQSLSFT